jgi:hypothetical protein
MVIFIDLVERAFTSRPKPSRATVTAGREKKHFNGACLTNQPMLKKWRALPLFSRRRRLIGAENVRLGEKSGRGSGLTTWPPLPIVVCGCVEMNSPIQSS